MINYDNKTFRVVENSENGEVSDGMEFHYEQHGMVLQCAYSGKHIEKGFLRGTVDAEGVITMSYEQTNRNGMVRTGICVSTPEIMSDGRIRLHENWRWTNGDLSAGTSVLEEF